jgi:hypothetical protein
MQVPALLTFKDPNAQLDPQLVPLGRRAGRKDPPQPVGNRTQGASSRFSSTAWITEGAQRNKVKLRPHQRDLFSKLEP